MAVETKARKPKTFVVEFFGGKPARLLDSMKYANPGSKEFIEKSAYDKAIKAIKDHCICRCQKAYVCIRCTTLKELGEIDG